MCRPLGTGRSHASLIAIGTVLAIMKGSIDGVDTRQKQMGWIQTGELAAMGTALLWTLSALAWTSAGQRVGALAVSFIRLGVACVFLLGYGQLFRGISFPSDASAETWAILAVSGFIGFFMADLCLFKALLMIGPRLTLLLQALIAPIAAVTSWAFLNDPLALKDWLAMSVTLAGVTWVVLERRDLGAQPRDRRHLRIGLFLAVAAAIGQAVGLVLSRRGIGDYDAGAATLIRAIGALAGFVVLISITRRWPVMATAVRHGRAMTIVVFGSFVGPFLGVVLSMVALRSNHAAAVATILSTMPVLILPFVVVLYREQVSLRAVAGAIVSVIGVGLLVL